MPLLNCSMNSFSCKNASHLGIRKARFYFWVSNVLGRLYAFNLLIDVDLNTCLKMN